MYNLTQKQISLRFLQQKSTQIRKLKNKIMKASISLHLLRSFSHLFISNLINDSLFLFPWFWIILHLCSCKLFWTPADLWANRHLSLLIWSKLSCLYLLSYFILFLFLKLMKWISQEVATTIRSEKLELNNINFSGLITWFL